jgi:hypothetical protein
VSLPSGPSAGSRPDGWQPVRHVAPSRRTGEIVGLTGAVVLLVAMLALQWFGAVAAGGPERAGANRALGAWQTMTITRWLIVGTVALTLGATALRTLRRGRSAAGWIAGTLALASGATAMILTYRVLINPPQPDRVFDVKLGAALGVAGGVAIAAGSWESWRSARPGARVPAQRPPRRVIRRREPLFRGRRAE